MKQRLRIYGFLGILSFLLFLFSCRKDQSIQQVRNQANNSSLTSNGSECGTPLVKELWDMGGVAKRGGAVISNDNNAITIKVTADAPTFVKKIIVLYGSYDHVRNAILQGSQWTPCDGPVTPDRVKISSPGVTTDTLQIPSSAFQSDNCTWVALYVTLTNSDGFEWCTYPKPYDASVNLSQWKVFFKYCKQECPPADCGLPVSKNLFDMGDVADRGDILISNNNDNIVIKATATDVGPVYVSKFIAIYGSYDHVRSALTQTVLWTPCQGPASPDRVKIVAPGLVSDTLQIPNSAFQSDKCTWIALFVTLKASQGGFEWCTYVKPYDAQIEGVSIWKRFFKYCRQDCGPTPPPQGECGPLTTYTPKKWGESPHGNNAGAYLHANFANAFANNLTVGCSPNNYYVRFTSDQAITAYLPANGDSKKLHKNYTNPSTSQLKSSLVSELVALTLNVGFDNFDPNFGQAGIHLGAMLINKGTFKGWTVNAFLAEANKILGGCSNSYSIEKIRETAKKINKSFEHQNNDGGNDDGGGDGEDDDDDDDDHDGDHDFLICPPIR